MSSRVRRLAASLALVVGAGALSPIGPVAAAPEDRTFAPLRGFEPTGSRIRVEPRDYAATRVDLAALRAELPRGGSDRSVVEVPDPDGRLRAFRVQRTQVMESELAAAHPEIVTWAGRSVDDPRVAIALDITPMGFHAFVREPGARSDWYVDPAYNRPGTTTHLSYRSAALPAPEQRRAEGEISALQGAVQARQSAERVAGQPVRRRYYRLALVSDPTYADYFGTANVLAEKATLVNRVNQIYNNDLAVELRLVNDTAALNLDTDAKATGVDGPCGAAPCYRPDPDGPGPNIPGDLDRCSGSTLGRNRTVLGQLIGAGNYDVGHLALGKNGGGVAYLGVVGGDYKGGGCTGLPQPRGDFFAIDYVAHEIGHQLGGNHTFNGALGACGGNISEASVEPGSGSSVMAYAGICGRDDLQPHTDPYFSFRTVDEAYATMDQTPYANVEVQTVSLRGFDAAGEAVVIGYGGGTRTLTRGSTYTAAGVELAVEQLTGTNVSIAQWGYDELEDPVGGPSDAGFQVIFNETPTVFTADGTDTDLPSLTVTSDSAGVSGFVGETARGGPSRAQGFPVTSANRNPTVVAPADRTLPVRTPFALTGSATDADGDPVVHLWEQTNSGAGTQLADNRKAYGPLFRVFGDDAVVTDEAALTSPAPGINIADGSPTRVFPDMAQVLAGNTNAASGACPTPTTPTTQQLPDTLLDCYSEFLPTGDYLGSAGAGDRVLRFRLTARDQSPSGGGLASDDVALRVDPSAGPFLVTSQAAPGTTLAGGSAVPVTWAVNNTQALAASVRITLSTDGGATFGTVLAPATANDGSETLVMPNVDAGAVRIRIEAVDNYFFDVNDASFALRATPAPDATAPASPLPPAPDTTITSGPSNDSIVRQRRQRFTYASTATPARFRCTVDGDVLPCDAFGVTNRFRAGTHVFGVAAVNAAGVADPTPATVTFTVPRDESTFVRKGSWKRVKDRRAFSGDQLTSQRSGSELVTRVPATDRIALVFGTVRNGGSARVFLGTRRLGVVRFGGKQSFSRLRTFVLPKARKGKVRVVVATNRPVRVEGLAVVTDG